MEISYLPLKQGIVGDVSSYGRAGGRVAASRERLNMNTEGKTCGAFEYHWPYMHAFHRRLNYLNRIWTSAPGWGCHGYRAPQSVSLSHTHTHTRGSQIWRCEFQRYPVKYCVAEVQHQAAAARQGELSNTQRLCWPRPRANLGCRQHRVLGDLNQSVKVSAPPSLSIFSSCKDFFPPLPSPCFSHLPLLSFFLKG